MKASGVLRSSDTGHQRIADALADVAFAAQRVLVDRAELLRLGVQRDARTYAVALALGGATLAMVGIALVAGAAAVVYALIPWLGTAAAFGVTAATVFVIAGATGVATLRVIRPASASPPLGLKAANEHDA